MSKPRLLDLFCGAGGCSKGYELAGFDVVTGVDLSPMPRYPFDFVKWDALDYLDKYGHEYDFIHASPPCQQHSEMQNIHKKEYRDFIADTRRLLQAIGLPYVIENVVNAPLQNWVLFRGDMFEGLLVKRDRLFECSFKLVMPATPSRELYIPSAGRGASPITGFVTIVGTGGLGNGLGIDYARKAMGIDWMSRKELSQAIPPYYTQYIGAEWLKQNGYAHSHPRLTVPKQLDLFGEAA
jgi:DNA (cytosine-5)-methyltransferase 1